MDRVICSIAAQKSDVAVKCPRQGRLTRVLSAAAKHGLSLLETALALLARLNWRAAERPMMSLAGHAPFGFSVARTPALRYAGVTRQRWPGRPRRARSRRRVDRF